MKVIYHIWIIDTLLHSLIAGKVVAKFCAKYLHQQVLKNEAYSAGDIGTSIHKAFFRLSTRAFILMLFLCGISLTCFGQIISFGCFLEDFLLFANNEFGGFFS